VVTDREAPAQKRCKNVATMLSFAESNLVFDEECHVAEPVADRRVVVHEIRRHIENNLDLFEKELIPALFHHRVVGGNPPCHLFATIGRTDIPFQDKAWLWPGAYPVRLLVLSCVRPAKLPGKIFILGQRQRRDQTQYGEHKQQTSLLSLAAKANCGCP
jgi:hypothetical protein